MAFSDILLFGDPHGDFEPLVTAAHSERPGAIAILGDLMLNDRGLEALRDIRSVCPVYGIAGNHDSDTLAYWRAINHPDLADFNLHNRITEICGVKVAGLSGVFRGSIWDGQLPITSEQESLDWTTWATLQFGAEFLQKALESNRQKALKHRCSIWPADFLHLKSQQADLLLTHEAPSCHPYGFSSIDELARTMGVKKVFHGHHHDRLDYSKQFDALGFEAYGVAMRGLSWGHGHPLVCSSFGEDFQPRTKKKTL